MPQRIVVLTFEFTSGIILPHMAPQSFQEFLAKKAYEISYAVFRLSSWLDAKSELRSALGSNAAHLLEAAVRDDATAAAEDARVLEYLLRLGGDSGILNSGHVDVVVRELADLESAIATQQFNLQVNLQNELQSAIQTTNQSASQSAIADYSPESEATIEENSDENGDERRASILQFILQSGYLGCRFKDIFEGLEGRFEELSERTVRYDLQELVRQGVIEKYGPGGAYTYYRAKSQSYDIASR